MATFEAQVNGLTGLGATLSASTTPTDSELDQFLKDGVLDVTNKCILAQPKEATRFQRESGTQNSNGFHPKGAKILSVLREANADGDADGSTAWRSCREIPSSLQSRVVDTDSLHFASIYNPVYTIDDNNTVFVYPKPDSANDGYNVFYVNNIPTDETNSALLLHSHSDIKYFPADKVYLVVIYASIQSLFAKMTSLNSALPSDIVLPAAPTQPSMNTTTVSLPSFTAPAGFVQPVVPAGVDIDFTSVPAAPTFVSVVSPVLTDNSLESWPSTPPVYTPPVMNPLDFSDTDNLISTEEDSEMLSARVQEIQVKIGEYSARIQNASQEFNDANVEFQSDMQQSLQNAQLSQADDAQKIQKYNGDLQNEVQRVTNDIKVYQAEITKAIQEYQAETGYDMAKYNSEVQSAVAKFTNDLGKNNTTFQADLGKFTADLKETQQENQEKIALHNAEIQKYTAELTGRIQEFTTRLQKDQADYQWTVAQHAALKMQYNEAFLVMAPPAQQQQQQRAAQRRR